MEDLKWSESEDPGLPADYQELSAEEEEIHRQSVREIGLERGISIPNWRPTLREAPDEPKHKLN